MFPKVLAFVGVVKATFLVSHYPTEKKGRGIFVFVFVRTAPQTAVSFARHHIFCGLLLQTSGCPPYHAPEMSLAESKPRLVRCCT